MWKQSQAKRIKWSEECWESKVHIHPHLVGKVPHKTDCILRHKMFLYYYYLLFVSHNIYLDYIDTRYSIPGIITSFGDSISKQNMAKKIQQSRKRKKKRKRSKWNGKQNRIFLHCTITVNDNITIVYYYYYYLLLCLWLLRIVL